LRIRRISRSIKNASLAAKVGSGIVLAIFVLVLVGPFFIPYGPYDTSSVIDSPPTLAHPFGTDYLGHDIMSQIAWGGDSSLLVGIASALGAALLGLLVGVVSGYYDRLQPLLDGGADIILTFPSLPLLILFGSMFPVTDLLITGILVFVLWPPISRSIRAQVMSVKSRPYIESAKVSGMTNREILTRLVIPEVGPIAIAYFVLTVAAAVVIVTVLQFLGVGNPDIVSWGSILYWSQQFAFYRGDWWWILAPGLIITLLALGFALIGFSVEEIMNPRLRT